jgi:hypothetical protein
MAHVSHDEFVGEDSVVFGREIELSLEVCVVVVVVTIRATVIATKRDGRGGGYGRAQHFSERPPAQCTVEVCLIGSRACIRHFSGGSFRTDGGEERVGTGEEEEEVPKVWD